MDVEGLGVADVVGAPHPVDERLAGQHPAGVGQQELEQLELLQRERHRGAPDDHLVALRVEGHVADLQRLPAELVRARVVGARRRSTARMRATSSRSRYGLVT